MKKYFPKQQSDSAFLKAMKDYFNDHYKHFNAYPMDFEYQGILYDLNICLELMDPVHGSKKGRFQ